MGSVLYEKAGPASCLISEGEDGYSRDEEDVDAGAGSYEANTVLGQVTATGVFKAYNPAHTDGTEHVAGILLYRVTGRAARTVLKRFAQVKSGELVWFAGASDAQIAAGKAALAALGVIVR